MILKQISGYPGYLASDTGLIFSVAKKKFLSSRILGEYLASRLVVNGKRREKTIHRLVCTAFHGKCPAGLECRHLDGDRLNNKPSNLKWGTPKENCADRSKHGNWKPRCNENSPVHKFTNQQVREFRERCANGEKLVKIHLEYGMSRMHAYRILKGELRKEGR